jgi:hypothetical protein
VNVTPPSAAILVRLGPQVREVIMDPLEAQARAIIAAALIIRGAVEVPTMPSGSQGAPDPAGVRLRELADYVYRLLTIDEPQEEE